MRHKDLISEILLQLASTKTNLEMLHFEDVKLSEMRQIGDASADVQEMLTTRLAKVLGMEEVTDV